MTIVKRIQVLFYKIVHSLPFLLKAVRIRTANAIFLKPVNAVCDYCGNEKSCATLEADWEVMVRICESCLFKALDVVGKNKAVQTDHRGVIMG